MDERERKLTLWDIVGSVLWFCMDASWMLGLTAIAQVLALPTVAVNALTFRYTQRAFSAYAVNAAMNAWLLMNVLWMVGEVQRSTAAFMASRFFLAVGALCLLGAYAGTRSTRETVLLVLARFRRFRIGP